MDSNMYFGRCTKFRFCSGGQSFSCCSNFFRAFSKIQEGMLLSLTGLKSSTVRILLTLSYQQTQRKECGKQVCTLELEASESAVSPTGLSVKRGRFH